MHVLHERPPLQRRYQVKALEYSTDGRYLLAGIERRQRDLWQPNQQGRLLRFDLHDPKSEPLERLDHGFLDVAWSPDQCHVAAVTGNRLHLYTADFDQHQSAQVLYGSLVSFYPDGADLLVALSRLGSGGLRRYSLHDDPLVQKPCGLRRDVSAVSSARDPSSGRWVVGLRDQILFWPGEPEWIPFDQPGWVQHLAFSPDGHLLAAASGWRVVLWEVGDDELVQRYELKGHRKEVTDLAFSPDGRLLLSTSLDETVRMWDPGSGREVAQLDCGTGSVRSVACHPDGTTAAIGGSRKSAIVLLDLP